MTESNVPATLSSDQRAAVLAQAVVKEVGRGHRVESQTNLQAILVKGKRPNHVLHLLLSVLTVGIWAIFVWLPLAIFMSEKRIVLQVDDFGNVLRQKA